jgi:hypothetical protein
LFAGGSDMPLPSILMRLLIQAQGMTRPGIAAGREKKAPLRKEARIIAHGMR